MGEDEELEVVVAERQLLEARERVRERCGSVDAAQREGGHAAQRHLGDHAERAEAHAGGAEDVGVELFGATQRRAVCEHERQLGHLCGDVAQTRAGAVRGRGDRPGDALRVDIAKVLQREPMFGQPPAECADRDPRLHAHQTRGAVDVEHGV